jgi:hypothetical protein
VNTPLGFAVVEPGATEEAAMSWSITEAVGQDAPLAGALCLSARTSAQKTRPWASAQTTSAKTDRDGDGYPQPTERLPQQTRTPPQADAQPARNPTQPRLALETEADNVRLTRRGDARAPGHQTEQGAHPVGVVCSRPLTGEQFSDVLLARAMIRSASPGAAMMIPGRRLRASRTRTSRRGGTARSSREGSTWVPRHSEERRLG